ncbi:hypothetical protein Q5752_005245 [Cryptotrichosporon argae]
MASAPALKRTRTAKPKLRSVYTHLEVPRAIDSDGSTEYSDSPPLLVPNDTLLSSLHEHAAAFYSARGLLSTPRRRVRSGPWMSRKRAALVAEGVVLAAPAPTRPTSGPSVSADGPSESDMDEDGRDGAGANERGAARRGNCAVGRRGKYKKRDMRLALAGSALVAIGMVVEEMVYRELEAAGIPRREEPQYELSDDGTDVVRGVSTGGGRETLEIGDEKDDGKDDENDEKDDEDGEAASRNRPLYTSEDTASDLGDLDSGSDDF